MYGVHMAWVQDLDLELQVNRQDTSTLVLTLIYTSGVTQGSGNHTIMSLLQDSR